MSSPRAIVILDFGGQYTQLIARRVREARVFSVVLPPGAPAEEIRKWNPAGIILSGGPQSVYEADSPRPSVDLTSLGIPVLGLCYGMQWLAQAAGGGGQRRPRVRSRRRAHRRRLGPVRGPRAGADGLDEPRGLRRRAALGLSHHRGDADDAARRIREPGTKRLGDPVPSRGAPHGA